MIDFEIPSVGVLGNFLSFNGAKISDIINAGIGGFGLISGIATVINALGGHSAFTNLSESVWNTWGPSGTGFAGVTGGAGRSLVYTGGAAGDITRSEYTDAASSATKTLGYDEGATKAGEKNVDDVWKELNELRNKMFGENREAILVDINPDTLPILPVNIEQISFSNNIANFVSGNVNP